MIQKGGSPMQSLQHQHMKNLHQYIQHQFDETDDNVQLGASHNGKKDLYNIILKKQ